MKLKNLKVKKEMLFLGMTLYSLILFVSGCGSFGLGSAVLTTKEISYIIPKGTEFTAIRLPEIKTPTKFLADDDMLVMYKGSYAEQEQLWNESAFKKAKTEKNKGLWIGILGSLMAAIAAFAVKNITSKKKL